MTTPSPRVPAGLTGEFTGADPSEKSHARLRARLVMLDIGGSIGAWVAAWILAGRAEFGVDFGKAILTAAALSLLTVAFLAVHRLYRSRVCAVRSIELGRLARSVVLCALSAAWLNRVAHFGPSPTVVVLGAACSFVVLMCLRTAYSRWLRACRARGLFSRRVCIVGDNDEAEALVNLLEAQPELGYRVVGVVGEPNDWCEKNSDIPIIERGGDTARAVQEVGASGVLVAASAMNSQELNQVVRQLIAHGIHVQVSSGLARVGHQRMRICPLSHQLIFYVEPPTLSAWQSATKRAIDIVVASIALLIAAPVIAVAAVAIKLNDGGPITYRQERVGRDDRKFEIVKLRTMVPDASSQLTEMAALNERNGPLFKLSFDPRVTRVGHFLRSTSIDELPQLLNVLRGEMSLVGPRPALPDEVAQFDVELLERVAVRPGITGLWQVEARDNPSFDAYRRLDLFYVDNWSVTMDLTILLATVGVVVSRGIRTLRGGAEILHRGRRDESVEGPPAKVTPLVTTASSEPGAIRG